MSVTKTPYYDNTLMPEQETSCQWVKHHVSTRKMTEIWKLWQKNYISERKPCEWQKYNVWYLWQKNHTRERKPCAWQK